MMYQRCIIIIDLVLLQLFLLVCAAQQVQSLQQQQQQHEKEKKGEEGTRRILIDNNTSITLDESIYDQTGRTNYNYHVDWVVNQQTINTFVLTEFFGIPVELAEESISQIGDLFTTVYNQLVTCNQPDTPGAKYMSIQKVNFMPSVFDGAGDTPTLGGSDGYYIPFTSPTQFTYLASVTFSCTGCYPDSVTLFQRPRGLGNAIDQWNQCIPTSQNFKRLFLQQLLQTQGSAIFDLFSVDEVKPQKDNGECVAQDAFESDLLLAVQGAPDLVTDEDLYVLEQAAIESYNELNALDPSVCDEFSHIVTEALASVVVDEAARLYADQIFHNKLQFDDNNYYSNQQEIQDDLGIGIDNNYNDNYSSQRDSKSQERTNNNNNNNNREATLRDVYRRQSPVSTTHYSASEIDSTINRQAQPNRHAATKNNNDKSNENYNQHNDDDNNNDDYRSSSTTSRNNDKSRRHHRNRRHHRRNLKTFTVDGKPTQFRVIDDLNEFRETSKQNRLLQDLDGHRRLSDDWFYIWLIVYGSCNGCPADDCLLNDVQNYSNCDRRRERRATTKKYDDDDDDDDYNDEEEILIQKTHAKIRLKQLQRRRQEKMVTIYNTAHDDHYYYYLSPDDNDDDNNNKSKETTTNDIPQEKNNSKRYLQSQTSNFADTACLCSNDSENAPKTLPQSDTFVSLLSDTIGLLQTDSLIQSINDVVYTATVNDQMGEIMQPDSCCGFPVDLNDPVNDDIFFTAIEDYMTARISGEFSEAAVRFGYPINCWNVSSVTSFANAFSSYPNFDERLNCWDTFNVVNMFGMFKTSQKFNRNIHDWDVNNVVNMDSMFQGALLFNTPLDTWNVESLQTAAFMFAGATSFNQPLESWRPTPLTTTTSMFEGAAEFNQDLCNWGPITMLESVDNMFIGTSCEFEMDPVVAVGPYCYACG